MSLVALSFTLHLLRWGGAYMTGFPTEEACHRYFEQKQYRGAHSCSEDEATRKNRDSSPAADAGNLR